MGNIERRVGEAVLFEGRLGRLEALRMDEETKGEYRLQCHLFLAFYKRPRSPSSVVTAQKYLDELRRQADASSPLAGPALQ